MPQSMPLRPALKTDPSLLDFEFRKRILTLSKPDSIGFILHILLSWLIIAATITIAILANNIAVNCLAILIIAGRQNVLALQMHEQAHYLGIKSRWGDLITDLLVCYPLLFVTVEGYARVHLTHHKKFFGLEDPDLIRKSGEEWTFPMEPRALLKLFLADLLGLTTISFIKGKNKRAGTLSIKRMGQSYAWIKPVYLLAWAIVFTVTHSWHIFLLFWLLPLLTVFQAFVRLGAICEHVYIPGEKLEYSTAIIIPNWFEQLVLPYHNFFYHVYHHYFPGIPATRLPEVHRIFVEEGLVEDDHIFKSIFSYIKHLTKSA